MHLTQAHSLDFCAQHRVLCLVGGRRELCVYSLRTCLCLSRRAPHHPTPRRTSRLLPLSISLLIPRAPLMESPQQLVVGAQTQTPEHSPSRAVGVIT